MQRKCNPYAEYKHYVWQEKPPNNAFEKNFRIAQDTISYCRSIIPNLNSSTYPFVTEKNILIKLGAQIKKVRNIDVGLKEAVYLNLMYPHDDFMRDVKISVMKSKIHKVGNCEELADLAIDYLVERGIECAEKLAIKNGNHVVVAIGRKGDTWGDSCLFIDVLNNNIFKPTEIYSKLYRYRFDKNRCDINGDSPHILTNYTENDELLQLGEISSKIDFTDNNEKLKDFHAKLNMISECCTGHLNEDKYKKLIDMIDKIKREKYNLNTLTNFDLERSLDKNIKKIIEHISSDENNANTLFEIINTCILENHQYSSPNQENSQRVNQSL